MTHSTESPRTAIRSFSGVYDFSRRILDQISNLLPDEADNITDLIEMDICPRCEDELPAPPEFPAGSRVTQCRSIPVCGPCGSDEVFTLAHPSWWPLDAEKIAARREHMMANAVPATVTVVDGKLKLLSEDGIADVQMGPSTGGWAEYGYSGGTFDAH